MLMSEEFSERHKIVRQTDSGLGVDAWAVPGGPSSPDPPCLSGLFCMTLTWLGSPMLVLSTRDSPLRRIEAWLPCCDSSPFPHCALQLDWRLDFPGATREAPWVPHHNLRETPNFLPQLKKNHEIPPSWWNEVLLFLQGLESNPEFSHKTRLEAWLPLGHSKISKRYLSHIERRAEFLASIRDKVWLPRWTVNATPRCLSPLERNPEILDTSIDEACFPCDDSRGIFRCSSQLEMRPDFPEAIWSGPWGSHRNSRATPNFPPSLGTNHRILPSTPDEVHSHCSV